MKNINCQVRPVTHIINVSYDHLNCNTRKKSQNDRIVSSMYALWKAENVNMLKCWTDTFIRK